LRKKIDIFTDGACSGNPGPAAYGVVIKDGGKTIKELSGSLGEATNNIAEYMAVIYALQEALILKTSYINLHTDSELLYNQLKGTYKVKNSHIKPLFEQIHHLAAGFQNIEVKRIPREQNKEADRLAQKVIKAEQTKAVASKFTFGEESPSSRG
jgi:ribonuclease HI